MPAHAVSDTEQVDIEVGDERIPARVVLWAAGVAASPLGRTLGVECDLVSAALLQKALLLTELNRAQEAVPEVEKRVTAARELRSGTPLAFRGRCTIIDQMFNSDPVGELTIDVPESLLDPLATVIAVEFE